MCGKLKYDVVPENEYTDFSDRETSGNGVLLGSAIAATASVTTYAVTKFINAKTVTSTATIPPIEPIVEPFNVLAQTPSTIPVIASNMNPDIIQTGIIAESSLKMLANVLDPVVQILVAISFPVASVIMVGACFFFMFGNSEKAWGTIMNAGIGYVLIQMSPLFLRILREIGNAI